MEYNGRHYCDYCFEQIAPNSECPNCHLTPAKYKTEPGLLMPGSVLAGKYVIGRTIGRGGFGATYLAFSTKNNSVVAIKEYYPIGIAHRNEGESRITVLSSDKENLFQKGANRFYEEAKIISTFNDAPNVATVYEFFYENNTAYYSMEYLNGVDLKNYVKKSGGRITEGEAVSIMENICKALIVIHSTGTIHRDISPDNIFVCKNNTAKLIDFGAAKQFVGEESQSLSVILKRGFAPIEQYQKNGKHGMWTDIYSLGATVYYALTGTIPDDAMSRIEKKETEIKSAAELGISEQFRNILNKCMQLKYQDRYKSSYEVQQELKRLPVMRPAFKSFDNVIHSSVGGASTQIDSMGTINNNQSIPIPPSGFPNSGYVPPSGYQTGYGQSGFPGSGFPGSGFPQSVIIEDAEEKHKKNVLAIALVAGAVVIIILVMVLIFKSINPGPPPMPGPPPIGQQDMPPGQQGGMPPGQPMQ